MIERWEAEMASEESSGNWPTRPPDCPCRGATAVNRDFFRLSDGADPLDSHLPVERYPSQWFDSLDTDESRCRAHAFSVYEAVSDVENLRRAVKKFRRHTVVRIQLYDDMGVVKQTGCPSHHSWWPAEVVTRPVPGQAVG
jgi:hypothetical protein